MDELIETIVETFQNHGKAIKSLYLIAVVNTLAIIMLVITSILTS